MIKIDAKTYMKQLGEYSDQFPYAVAAALTATAKQAQEAIKAEMPRAFKSPTPYTLNSMRIKPATKANPVAEIAVKDATSGVPPVNYLFPEVDGGARRYKRSENSLRSRGLLPSGMFTAVGQGAPIDGYGNLPAGVMNAILSQLGANNDAYQNANPQSKRKRERKVKGTFFVGKPGGGRKPLGVWYREPGGRRIKPYLIFTRQPSYRPRLPWNQITQRVYDERFADNFALALARAVATRR